MATCLKTVEYWFPVLATAVDAVDTALTQITISLPESSKVFNSVYMEAVVHDRNTTLGNLSRHQLSLRLGAASYTVSNNANAITQGGEQSTYLFTSDFTAHFTANWTGTSMTCDANVLFDTAVAAPLNPAFSNISVRLVITYEYDNTSTTHVKTVRIPLNMPVGAMGTSKPGTALATIPALDTELPEASKSYKQIVIVLQGNDNATAATDIVFNMQVDTGTAYVSQAYEHGSTVAMFIRAHDVTTFATDVTHGFYAWATANGNHMQAYLLVTYEFDATAANDTYMSLILPLEIGAPMGGTTSSDFQRAERELWIQEANIVQKQVAFYYFWDSQGAISALYFRLGTGSFIAYTDTASVVGGSNACMIRNDSAFTLARGRNTFNVDTYRTDATDVGYNTSGFFIVNYTADKPTGGHGVENHTILFLLRETAASAPGVHRITSAIGIPIPETDYFITALGTEHKMIPSSTSVSVGFGSGVERLAAEGGQIWEILYADLSGGDGETGIYHAYSQVRTLFKRFPGDADTNRFDIETARRYRMTTGGNVGALHHLAAMFSYHSILYTISGTLSGFGTGTVNIELRRAATGEVVKRTTRSGNGTYSFTWYDDTEEMQIVAYEDDTHTGISKIGLAGS